MALRDWAFSLVSKQLPSALMVSVVRLSPLPVPHGRIESATADRAAQQTATSALRMADFMTLLSLSNYLSPTGTFSTRIGTSTVAPTPLTSNPSDRGALGFPATTIWQDRSSPPPDSS